MPLGPLKRLKKTFITSSIYEIIHLKVFLKIFGQGFRQAYKRPSPFRSIPSIYNQIRGPWLTWYAFEEKLLHSHEVISYDDSDLLFKPASQTLHLNGFFPSWTDWICSSKFTFGGKTSVANVTPKWLLSVMNCFNIHIQRFINDFVLIYSNWRKPF